MSRVLDTDALINSTRRRAMIPEDSSAFSDEDVLEILNEEMDVGLLSKILSLNEEHMVVSEDIAIDTSIARYTIPHRAIGNKLREVSFVDTLGNITEVTRVSVDHLSSYSGSNSSYSNGLSPFYVQGDEIVFIHTDYTGQAQIRMHYYIRPNKLVDTNRTAKITSIDRANGFITIDQVPSEFVNLPKFDFIGYRTPNKIVSYDVQVDNVNSNTKTITLDTSKIPTKLMVGDYVCIEEESPVANIPTEFHPVLCQRAAVHILEAMGDGEALQTAMVRLSKMEESVMQLIDDRVEGSPQKITAKHSPLSSATGSKI